LTDGFEVNTSLSNPMDTDSDNGGILDKYESDNAMNPNSATDDKDSDGDGVPNFVDLDDDNDGVSDVAEGTGDIDGDGVPNSQDLDSDNDGINDVREAVASNVNNDTNNDGRRDGTAGTNGVIGTAATPTNSDNDIVPDMFDLDSDNDGLSDLSESGYTGANIDINNNGVIDNVTETDLDGIMAPVDGATTYGDLNDPMPLNSDSDINPNYRDVDSNNDGRFDNRESGSWVLDGNNDGMIDSPIDADNDGIADNSGTDNAPGIFGGRPAVDSDNDGIPNYLDLDDDNDGISDATEGTVDTDGDGVPNNYDLDSDNDGINDVREANGIDADNNGMADGSPNATGEIVVGGLTPPNTDGDSVPDYLDLDSDNDALSDLVESGHPGIIDLNNDGVVDGPDADGDGIRNSADGNSSVFGDLGDPQPRNTDLIDNPDYRDLDSNNDGMWDIVAAGEPLLDANNDGKVDSTNDPDGDGIMNPTTGTLDTLPASFGGLPARDSDNDGIVDANDLDDDNDGILDTVEGATDKDGDGIPNCRDLDSDNDGINDVREADGVDVGNDGLADGTPNAFGIPSTAGTGGLTPPDTDGDGVRDYHDLDSDNDALSDLVESGYTTIDANNDGVVDGPDDDKDGIMNSADSKATFGDQSDPAPKNSDTDIVPDYRDLDSNNDNVRDIINSGYANLDANLDGKIDNPTDPDGDGIANNGGLDTIPTGFGGLPLASTGVKISAKVSLQGAATLVNNPFTQNGDSMMRTDLTSILPNTQPYSGLGFSSVTVKAGIPSFAGTGNDAIVDWILVELRSSTSPTTVIARQAGLLQKDGDIVDIDGVSPLTIPVASGSYHVAIRHRNHLGAMTAATVSLGSFTTSVDFTSTGTLTYGTNAQVTIGGKNHLWAGNANVNTNVIAQGGNSDRSAVTNNVTGQVANASGTNAYILTGYFATDVNMDGKSISKGVNADNTTILNVILGHPNNANGNNIFILAQQLP
jgi:large repetitive protein